ncbi:mammalian cell entry protein [Nocardia mangyaensis]|uniref:Mammalian cell entry protein n=1 Tax=Nocardia mangyaensis TaxID=2213200 RepID=A0A1J0VYB9_9NOCA|nr:MCE family protein [Nocardia mangyaensis]APE37072.1 mammalian cell entry protein [Nocardia mangyaensis]
MTPRRQGLKLLAFVVVTSLITGALFVVVGDLRFVSHHTYRALFSSASGLRTGEDVKLSGVVVGKVEDIGFGSADLVEVEFTVDDNVALLRSATAAIKYKNLIGDRYLELTVRADDSGVRPENETIPDSQTHPALDLDALVNGFRPLLQGIDPDETNKLSASLVAVLNGREQSISAIVEQLGSLGNSVADRDAVIGRLIDNLNLVLRTISGREDQFGALVTNLQRLVSGLNSDRDTLTNALVGIDDLSGQTAQVLQENRPSIAADIEQLGRTAGNLNASSETLQLLLTNLPEVYRRGGRASGYGSFVNFFLCGVAIRYPAIGGGHSTTPMFTVPADRCK